MIDPATFTRMHKLNVLAGTSVNEAMRNIFVFFAKLLNFSTLQIVYGFKYPLGLKWSLIFLISSDSCISMET